ncbi:MAG: hypothetical protein J7647_00750 [Cyanobacteria bacterium SBLK]|nr:hypothetical protein [Cyanobacteria bacterium SBLK]
MQRPYSCMQRPYRITGDCVNTVCSNWIWYYRLISFTSISDRILGLGRSLLC